MVMAVKIKFDSKDLIYLSNKLSENLPLEINNAGFQYAKLVRDSLRKGLMSVSKSKSADKIHAKKLSKFRSVVTMPNKLTKLDSMQPHYVSLKRGRLITQWVKRHIKHKPLRPNRFNTERRSRVYRGPRGGILYSKGNRSVLYVKPHPFVTDSLRKVRNKLKNELRKGVRKAFKQSKR